MSTSLRLQRERCVLLIIDVQERLAQAMPADKLTMMVRNATILLEAARRMSIPVVLSEQYPQGLGPTVSGIAEALGGIEDLTRLEKLDFSVCACDEFAQLGQRLAAAGRTQWIVAGMETHICVYQSARALREAGHEVHVVADAVVSRSKHNYRTGLSLVESAGALVSSTETVVMDLLSRAQGDDFKAISKLIR